MLEWYSDQFVLEHFRGDKGGGKTPLETSVGLIEGVKAVKLRLVGSDGVASEHDASVVDGRIVYTAGSRGGTGAAISPVRRSAELRGTKTGLPSSAERPAGGSASTPSSGSRAEQDDDPKEDKPAEAGTDEDLDLPAGYKDNPY